MDKEYGRTNRMRKRVKSAIFKAIVDCSGGSRLFKNCFHSLGSEKSNFGLLTCQANSYIRKQRGPPQYCAEGSQCYRTEVGDNSFPPPRNSTPPDIARSEITI